MTSGSGVYAKKIAAVGSVALIAEAVTIALLSR
jgi:hypothetical protein